VDLPEIDPLIEKSSKRRSQQKNLLNDDQKIDAESYPYRNVVFV
jgi:hypothetical protein